MKIMIVLRTVDLRNDIKRVSELVNSGEKVLIARPRNQNLVILSERDYNKLEKARLKKKGNVKPDKSE